MQRERGEGAFRMLHGHGRLGRRGSRRRLFEGLRLAFEDVAEDPLRRGLDDVVHHGQDCQERCHEVAQRRFYQNEAEHDHGREHPHGCEAGGNGDLGDGPQLCGRVLVFLVGEGASDGALSIGQVDVFGGGEASELVCLIRGSPIHLLFVQELEVLFELDVCARLDWHVAVHGHGHHYGHALAQRQITMGQMRGKLNGNAA